MLDCNNNNNNDVPTTNSDSTSTVKTQGSNKVSTLVNMFQNLSKQNTNIELNRLHIHTNTNNRLLKNNNIDELFLNTSSSMPFQDNNNKNNINTVSSYSLPSVQNQFSSGDSEVKPPLMVTSQWSDPQQEKQKEEIKLFITGINETEEVIVAENKQPELLSFEFRDKFGSRLSLCSKNDELRDVNSELSLSVDENSKTSQKLSAHRTDTPQSNASVTLSTIVAMTDTSFSKQESDSSLSSNDMVTTTRIVDSVENYNNNNNNDLPSGIQHQQQQQEDNNSLTQSSSMQSSCSIPACSGTIVGGNVNNSNMEDTFTSIPLHDTVEDSQRSGERMKKFNNFNLDEILSNIDTIRTEIIDEDDDEVKIYGGSSNSSSKISANVAAQSVSSGSNVTTTTINGVVVINSNEKNLNNEDNICKLFLKKVFCWTG
jgi:hypothetical protein